MFRTPLQAVNRDRSWKSTIGQFLTSAESWWLPPHCCLCGLPVSRAESVDLCGHCRASLPWRADSERADRGAARLLVAPLRYAYPADHMIRALKFRNEGVYARVLGALIAEARGSARVPERFADAYPLDLPQLVVPIPLHAERLRERGFNQAAEIARHAARALGVALDIGLLERTRQTAEQSLLAGEARSRNVEGAFRMRSPRGPVRVALVDDVLTTGSTLAAAARALRVGGIDDIEIWVAARAGRESSLWGPAPRIA